MFESLITQGYCRIANWLEPQELGLCRENLDLARAWADVNGSSNGNYSVMADRRPHPLYSKITACLALIRAEGAALTDTVRTDAVYFDTGQFKFPWHQDHEPYFQYWDNRNQLTFWIPLIKTQPDLAGLELVALDLLRARVGESLYLDRFEGRGAKLFTVHGSRTRVVDDYRGDSFWLDFDINQLAHAPSLMPGDLLIFRGDVMHRSQAGGHRAAMAVRTYNSSAWVLRKDIVDCSAPQQVMMSRNPRGYARIIKAFTDQPHVDRLRVKDI